MNEVGALDQLPCDSLSRRPTTVLPEIVAAIERQYRIKIEDDELADFSDLESAYALVLRKLEAKDASAAAE